MVEAEPQKFLGRKQRHSCLIRCAVSFTLVTTDARCDQICRRAFPALRSRKYMVERQVLCMFVLTAVLAAISISNVNARTLHRRLAAIAPYVDVMTKANHRRDCERRRRRMQDVVAVVLFDKNRPAKPQAHRPRDADSSERLVRKVQK